jgi:hypothetical protein
MNYYYYIFFSVAILIIVILYNSQTKEHFKNDCSNKTNCASDFGPMDRPNNLPSCFYYDIDQQNEQLYNALDRTATGLDKEINRSLNIDNRLSAIANEYNTKLNLLMSGPIVNGIKTNIFNAAILLARAIENIKTNINNINIDQIYSFNQNDMQQTIRLAIELHIQNVINTLIQNSNINLNDSVMRALTVNIRNRISIPIYNQFMKKFNENSNRDIINILRNVIQDMKIYEQIYCRVSNLFSISNPSIPTLSLTNFPLLGSMPNWEMNINFNVSGGQGRWRALIGNMYNNVNWRGWGIWVSYNNNIHFSWQSVTWFANPAFTVQLNVNYNLKVTMTPTSLNLILTNLNNNTTQTATNNSITGYVMPTNGPVTIGGWINYSGENFPGTISRITVV